MLSKERFKNNLTSHGCTCIHANFLESSYEEVKRNLSWIGERCIEHEELGYDEEPEILSTPRWRKTMNLSLSCFITALIIITAAMLLVS